MNKDQINQGVYMLLRTLSSAKKDEVTMFKTMYREFFSTIQVPTIKDFGEIVLINRHVAIDFLKRTYDFYTKEELHQTLSEIAEEINGTKND
jgi:hypothetical protein